MFSLMFCIFSIFTSLFTSISCDNYSFINLPNEQLPYYFSSFPQLAKRCIDDLECPYKKYADVQKCWGYESSCSWANKFHLPRCPGDHKGWVKTKQDQLNTFYTQADFGYIRQQQREMKLLCEPLFLDDSSLECSEHLRFCRGRNLMINFTALAHRDEPMRYNMNVLKEGEIGGYCELKKDSLDEQLDHMSPLQSWAPEMRFFTKLDRRPIVEGDCDVIVEKPTFIMKIDATVNMYHHFCDFLNLYASLHLNATEPRAFSTDVHILIWETYTYYSTFSETWKAFTRHPLWDLKTFKGDTVCFKNVVFPLLPRMIFGLYYNTPIIYGCEGSGLFKAFSQHILHRLDIPFQNRTDDKIRITLLSRDTKYRRILNENELLKAIEENDRYVVNKVVFNKKIGFSKQLEISRNTDIFIGIHGAGLTHSLFLPEWAVLFELYNCEDPNCYYDLSRLVGVKYITWENDRKIIAERDRNIDVRWSVPQMGESHTGGAHAKFANYSFDIQEFTRLVEKAAKHVKNHPQFKKLINTNHDEL